MRVYKYLSIEYAIDDLIKHRLKIAEYHDMNDPFELHGCFVRDPLFEKIRQFASGHGVLCFSTSDSEPLLWSHYAEKYRGCCISFDIDESVSLEQTVPIDTPRELLMPMAQLIAFAQDRAQSGKFPIPEGDPELEAFGKEIDFEKSIRAVLFSKYSGWNYEREARILIALKREQKDGSFYFADFDYMLNPVEVLLGARCTKEDEEKLLYAVNRYAPALPVIRTTLATDSFRVIRMPPAR